MLDWGRGGGKSEKTEARLRRKMNDKKENKNEKIGKEK